MTPPPHAEYDALTTGCGYVRLDGWSVVTLTGEDRHTFLHNMCTNDIKKLSARQGCEAFFTDVKGKILAHTFVILDQDRTYLLTVPEQAESLITHLDRYIIREDVQLTDETENTNLVIVAGPSAEELLKQLAPDESRVPFTEFPLPGRNAYLFLLNEQLEHSSAIACGFAAWNTIRIESGFPLYGIDFNHENLPQEVARNEQAISFTKGCYLGQETVARLDALGHVNKELVTVKFSGEEIPEPPIPLTYQDKQVGAASSVAWSPALGAPIGVAMVRREANTVGTKLDSPAGSVEVVATPVAV